MLIKSGVEVYRYEKSKIVREGKLMEGKTIGRNKLTLRMPNNLDEATKRKAEYLGISQNALLIILIDLGLRYYEANPFPLDE